MNDKVKEMQRNKETDAKASFGSIDLPHHPVLTSDISSSYDDDQPKMTDSRETVSCTITESNCGGSADSVATGQESKCSEKTIMMAPAFHSSSPSVGIVSTPVAGNTTSDEKKRFDHHSKNGQRRGGNTGNTPKGSPHNGGTMIGTQQGCQLQVPVTVSNETAQQVGDLTNRSVVSPGATPPVALEKIPEFEDSLRLVVVAELVSTSDDDVERQIQDEVAERIAAHTRNQVVAQAVLVQVPLVPIQEVDSDEKVQSVTSWWVKRRTAIIVALVVVVCAAVTAGVIVGKEENEDSESPSTASDPFRIILDPWIIRPDKDTDLDVFNDPESPQSLALQWLKTDLISNSEQRTTNTVLERYVLMVLYYATDGDRWSGKGLSLTNGMATCDWQNYMGLWEEGDFGIYCENQPNVTHIVLSEGELSGTIPWELSLLSELVLLDLNGNKLRGTIPSEFSKLTKLQFLWLSMNKLSGNLPADLPSSMYSIDFEENSLAGTLPVAWGERLDKVVFLDLAGNKLTGPLPLSWQGLRDIQELKVALNQLNGTIPPELFQSWPKVKSIYLARNDFSGPLPSEIGQLSLLEHLWLHKNNFIGMIPTELGNLTAMTYFGCEYNSLTGPLPSELGQMTALQQLWIDNNDFTGTMPTELAQLPNLTSFSFYATNLTGSLNDTLCATNQSWTDLQGDCAADGSGYVEIECPCCTGCCFPTTC